MRQPRDSPQPCTMVQERTTHGCTMGQAYTIGELARAAGVPTTTVRFYERQRLLVPDARSGSNYRLYGAASLDRLRFIRSAQAAGFTLGDIRSLLDFKDGATPPCREVQALIESRLKLVAEQLEHLHHVQAVLGKWLTMCRKAERSGRCRVIEGLVIGGVGDGCPECRPKKCGKTA